MSYDLYPADGQTTEARYAEPSGDIDEHDDPGPLSPSVERQMRDMAAAITAVNPAMLHYPPDDAEVATHTGASTEEATRQLRHIELDEGKAGIQLSIFDDHLYITVPYRHKAPAAARLPGNRRLGLTHARRWRSRAGAPRAKRQGRPGATPSPSGTRSSSTPSSTSHQLGHRHARNPRRLLPHRRQHGSDRRQGLEGPKPVPQEALVKFW